MRRIVQLLLLSSLVIVLAACGQRPSAPPDPDVAAPVEAGAGAVQAYVASAPNSVAIVAEGSEVRVTGPDGAFLWRFDLPGGDAVAAPPVSAANSQIFVRGKKGIYALGPDGALLWQVPHSDEGDSVPAIAAMPDSTVVVTSRDSLVVSYNEEGQVRWTFELPNADRMTGLPAVAPGSLLYVPGAQALYAIDVQGNLAWQQERAAG